MVKSDFYEIRSSDLKENKLFTLLTDTTFLPASASGKGGAHRILNLE